MYLRIANAGLHDIGYAMSRNDWSSVIFALTKYFD